MLEDDIIICGICEDVWEVIIVFFVGGFVEGFLDLDVFNLFVFIFCVIRSFEKNK